MAETHAQDELIAAWKLVPVEPTPEMIRAAHHALFQYREKVLKDPQQDPTNNEKHAIRYRAMLAASPPPEYLSGQEAVPATKRKHGYTVNLTDEEMDALEALAKEHDLPPWRVLLQGLRLYQLDAHPVDLGPMLPPELATPDLKAGKAEVGETLTKRQQFLLEWLGKAESSALGECRGPDLYALGSLIEISGDISDGDYRRVSLTDAGRAALNPGAPK